MLAKTSTRLSPRYRILAVSQRERREQNVYRRPNLGSIYSTSRALTSHGGVTTVGHGRNTRQVQKQLETMITTKEHAFVSCRDRIHMIPVASGRRLVGGNVQAVLLPCGATTVRHSTRTLSTHIYALLNSTHPTLHSSRSR